MKKTSYEYAKWFNNFYFKIAWSNNGWWYNRVLSGKDEILYLHLILNYGFYMCKNTNVKLHVITIFKIQITFSLFPPMPTTKLNLATENG